MHVEIGESSQIYCVAVDGSTSARLHGGELALLKFPFAARANNENLDDVVRRNHVFLRRYGLLDSAIPHQLQQPDIVQYAAQLYPMAEDAPLDVAVDAVTWCFLWRDEYERLYRTDAQAANTIVWQLVDLTLHRAGIQPADDAPPLIWAFANLWRRETASMSLSWQQRAATHWRKWFLCFAAESMLAELATDLTLDAHVPDRQSAKCAVFNDLLEGCLKFELPRGAYESLEVEGLRDIQADSMRWVSDLFAAHAGDPPKGSVIHLLQSQRGLRKDEAIREAILMHDRLMQRWCWLCDRLPELCATLRLSEEGRIQLQRYVIGIEWQMAGHHAWHAGQL